MKLDHYKIKYKILSYQGTMTRGESLCSFMDVSKWSMKTKKDYGFL